MRTNYAQLLMLETRIKCFHASKDLQENSSITALCARLSTDLNIIVLSAISFQYYQMDLSGLSARLNIVSDGFMLLVKNRLGSKTSSDCLMKTLLKLSTTARSAGTGIQRKPKLRKNKFHLKTAKTVQLKEKLHQKVGK